MQDSVTDLSINGKALILTDPLFRSTIGNYENLIVPLVQSIQSFNDLALDMTVFNMLRYLSEKDS